MPSCGPLSAISIALALVGVAASSGGGLHCESNPCMYGICVDEGAEGSYRCYCIDGYTGINCETNWDDCWSSPCANGGTCSDAIASYNCSCAEGFVGPNCEQRYSECMSQPCQNNATCSDHDGLACHCLEGFSGEFCEHDAAVCNRTLCRNGAECVEGPGLSFRCSCPPGWAGELCERDVDECAASSEPALCRNGALCINLPGGYQCACLFGFTGKDCDKPIVACEDSPCENGAVCLLEDGQPVCYCVPDYHGALCELRYDDCQSKAARCHNGGRCVDGVDSFSCACPPPFAGDSCDGLLPTAATSAATTTDETATTATTATTVWVPEERDGEASPADDYDQTVGSSLTDDSSTDRPPPLPVTMLPSSLVPSTAAPTTTTTTTISTSPTDGPSTLDAEATATTPAATTAAADNDDEADFTSVGDFHRTTFGTDIDDAFTSSEASTAAYSTASSPGYSTGVPSTGSEPSLEQPCAGEQCANVTRCSFADNCLGAARPSLDSAAFNGQSYIRQTFGFEHGLLSILVRLKTKAKSGILIHALFDDERYVLLYMEAAQLKFQFSCGSQTMLFGELDSPLNNGFEVELEMRFRYVASEAAADRCEARLLVNATLAMSGEQVLQSHDSVPRLARLHLGGIPVALSHQFPQIVLGFVGCMSLLKVNDVKRDFVRDSIEAVQIEECRSFLCLSNPCQNFGACEEVDAAIRCKCIAGYSGETCEHSICDNNPCHLGATCLVSPGVNFICVCPLGTHGLLCEQDTTIVQPSFSVFAPGFSSYMAYGVSSSLKDTMELRMRIIPQNVEQISLIAYMGQSGAKRPSSDHFSLTYVRGYLMLTWDLGSGVRRIFTSSPIDLRAHKAHALHIGRRARDAWLYVEGVGNVTGRAAGANTRLDVSPILYIGGHKTKYFESLPHDLPLHTGFSGCIYDVELRTDDNVFPITMSSPATGRGVGECHRNECSHHTCKNGAVCLNYGPTYSCICMKDWQGPDCSNAVNCTSSESLCY